MFDVRLSYNSTRDLKMEIFLFLPISSLKSTSLWNFRIILNLCTMKSKREIKGKLDDSYWSLFFLSTRMPFLQKYLPVKSIALYIIHHLSGNNQVICIPLVTLFIKVFINGQTLCTKWENYDYYFFSPISYCQFT